MMSLSGYCPQIETCAMHFSLLHIMCKKMCSSYRPRGSLSFLVSHIFLSFIKEVCVNWVSEPTISPSPLQGSPLSLVLFVYTIGIIVGRSLPVMLRETESYGRSRHLSNQHRNRRVSCWVLMKILKKRSECQFTYSACF